MRYRVFSNEPQAIERDVETALGPVRAQFDARVVQFVPVDEPENSTIRIVFYPGVDGERYTVDSEFTLAFRAVSE